MRMAPRVTRPRVVRNFLNRVCWGREEVARSVLLDGAERGQAADVRCDFLETDLKATHDRLNGDDPGTLGRGTGSVGSLGKGRDGRLGGDERRSGDGASGCRQGKRGEHGQPLNPSSTAIRAQEAQRERPDIPNREAMVRRKKAKGLWGGRDTGGRRQRAKRAEIAKVLAAG